MAVAQVAPWEKPCWIENINVVKKRKRYVILRFIHSNFHKTSKFEFNFYSSLRLWQTKDKNGAKFLVSDGKTEI